MIYDYIIRPNPEDPDRQEGLVRVVGKRKMRTPGIRWPTAEEQKFIDENPRKVLLRHPKGVIRYRNHEEAQAHLERLMDEAAFEQPLFRPVKK